MISVAQYSPRVVLDCSIQGLGRVMLTAIQAGLHWRILAAEHYGAAHSGELNDTPLAMVAESAG